MSSESAFRKLKESLSSERGIPDLVFSQEYLNKSEELDEALEGNEG